MTKLSSVFAVSIIAFAVACTSDSFTDPSVAITSSRDASHNVLLAAGGGG